MRRIVSVLVFALFLSLCGCERPNEDIVLRSIKDVVADASSDPKLNAVAVFYNPNDIHGRLKHINIEIFVNGKKAGVVNKDYKIKIPAKGEFSVPIEVALDIKQLGSLGTLLGMIGGKKFQIQYEGKLGLTYHGIPFKVPVHYKDDVRISF